MKYVKTEIKQFNNVPGIMGGIIEARVAVLDTDDMGNSPYDRMVTVDDVENPIQKAKVLDRLMEMLSEARKYSDTP